MDDCSEAHPRTKNHSAHAAGDEARVCHFFFSSRRRHTRFDCDWSSDVCSSDLPSSTVSIRRRGSLTCSPASTITISRTSMSLSPGIGRPDLTNWRHEPSQEKRSNSFNEIATVRIELQDTDPVIWRQVEVPTSITLKVLHDIVQAVMGWCDDHLSLRV